MKVSQQNRYLLANWKMSQDLEAVKAFFEAWAEKPQSEIYTAVMCSFVHLPLARQLAREKVIHLGAQDCSDEKKGAYTGEISSQQLRELDVEIILVGHSERRRRQRESSEQLKRKTSRIVEEEMIPVLCVGETQEEREEGRCYEVLKEQLSWAKDFAGDLIVAYEPVWAIGSGRSASLSDVREAHRWIHELAGECPVLYGGSANAENAREILALPEVRGLLVGSASLSAESFASIFRTAVSLHF